MKVFVALAVLLAAVSAAPEPHYYGPHLGYYPHHQLQWPSVRGPGFSATCFGCRGKRSAEADAEAGGVAVHPGHATSYVNRSPQGLSAGHLAPYYYGYHPYLAYHHLGKREADADAEAGVSYVGRTVYGYPGHYGYYRGYHGYPYYRHFGKRSADADAGLAYHPVAYHGYPYYYHGYHGYPHHGHATSYVGRTVFGYPAAEKAAEEEEAAPAAEE